MKFRIVQRVYGDGGVKYVLEKAYNEEGPWTSTYAHDDLEVIKEAKKKREMAQVFTEKVIE